MGTDATLNIKSDVSPDTSQDEHSNPGVDTPNTTNSESVGATDNAVKTCASKNCVHKVEAKDTKKEKEKKKTAKKAVDDNDSDSSDDESSSNSSDDDTSDSDSDSDDEKDQHKKKIARAKKALQKLKAKSKKGKSSKDDSSDKSTKKSKKESSSSSDSERVDDLKAKLEAKGYQVKSKKKASATDKNSLRRSILRLLIDDDDDDQSAKSVKSEKTTKTSKSEKSEKSEVKEKKEEVKRASKVEFKRLDQKWDESICDYKLTESSKDKQTNEWDEYVFNVRRRFDYDNHYEDTVVDIKSEELKDCLKKVMGEVQCVSLVDDTPTIDPNMLFLFLEEFRELFAELNLELQGARKKKLKKAAKLKASHLEVLITYLDKDFDETKKRLYPMLKNGTITFDLLWALYKPNTIAYVPTYGDESHPRTFRLDYSYKDRSFQRGVYYAIEGQYLDFDGKSFGMGDLSAEVPKFQGTRKITSLACYPLKFHPDAEALKVRLLGRGKRFLMLSGQNYQNGKGLGFHRKENGKMVKANVSGRIMIDPATFRRVNPNYDLREVESRKIEKDLEDVDRECTCKKKTEVIATKPKVVRLFRLVKNEKQPTTVVELDAVAQKAYEDEEDPLKKASDAKCIFSEEELLTASPVLPGFAFSEKLWLELTVDCVSDVTWNEGAFDSLVLPDAQKEIVKALVSSHGVHSAKSIDDVISGKGKGLVAVLHGKPGLGKTLTCEAVSDLLRRPLYTVSAGDLGTEPTCLEHQLQTILDVAHTWGAVLLMDEADVFLEERSIHDVHRNALVSIFLRLLEYFQGILFLTTNRVETFDEAFVSRIHLSLRYGELSTKAKRAVWLTFIEKVRNTENMKIGEFKEADYDELSRREANGRQIKNLVKTAQALALYEDKPMSMDHIRKVMEVARSFEMDLKGGTGWSDAMKSYI